MLKLSRPFIQPLDGRRVRRGATNEHLQLTSHGQKAASVKHT